MGRHYTEIPANTRTWGGRVRKVLRSVGILRPRTTRRLSNTDETLLQAVIGHRRARRWRDCRRNAASNRERPAELLSKRSQADNANITLDRLPSRTRAGRSPENFQETFLNEDDQSTSSSLGSDTEEASGAKFIGLLTRLFTAEREREEAVSEVEQAREKLEIHYRAIECCRAELRHIAKRRRRKLLNYPRASHELDENDEFEAQLKLKVIQHTRKVDLLLSQLHEGEGQLQTAIEILSEGEPLLFRAAGGFLRNTERFDTQEKIIDRPFRCWLRLVADCGRDESNAQRLSERVGNEPMTQRSTEGKIVLSPWQATAFRRTTYRKRMTDFYSHAKPLLVAQKAIEPEPEDEQHASIPEGEAAGAGEAQVDRPTKQKLLEELQEAREEVDEAILWLEIGVPAGYATAKEEKIFAFEDDGEPDSDEEEPPPQQMFDREHLSRISRANDRLREAEARWHELQNQALEQNVMDLNEPDLFGPADHASDGFTDSFCTSMCDEREQKAAMKKPRLAEWVRTAEGRGFRLSSEPSVIADIETGSSVRSAISAVQNDTRPELVERWKAEMVVVREELEPRLREWEEFKQAEKDRHRNKAAELAARAAEAETAGSDS